MLRKYVFLLTWGVIVHTSLKGAVSSPQGNSVYLTNIKNRLYLYFVFADSYDAVVTTGSFAPGHLNEDCYEDLISITKKGRKYFQITSSV